MRRAIETASEPELACVVLALAHPPELIEAVRSLVDQEAPVEIVVVHSNGRGISARLAAAGFSSPRVACIERSERLLPGAARNLGIAASRAPFIAFLAADCRAEPGWVAARLAAHRAGAPAVASAVTNLYAKNLAAWASYLALFARRMPGTPEPEALRYGVSYARDLFDRFGTFREDLRTGEDTEFHQRLGAQVPIAWAPEVRTAHRHPQRLSALWVDQFRRGRRSAAAWSNLAGPSARRVAADALTRIPACLRIAWHGSRPGERAWIAAASLALPGAALAYAAGALWGRAPVPEPEGSKR